jgi:hypothetical protein
MVILLEWLVVGWLGLMDEKKPSLSIAPGFDGRA